MFVLIAILAASMADVLCLQFYNHDPSTYRNQNWMTNLDDGVPLRQMTIPGTHSSLSTGLGGDPYQTQGSSVSIQLASGIRALNIKCKHLLDQFIIHQRAINLNIDLSGVLDEVRNFLISYPGQTVLVHIVEQDTPSSNTRSFQDTFLSYKNSFSDLIWTPTTQNPTLGMTRGKVVILQNFPGAIHGLSYDSFTSLPHRIYSNNWNQHDRWISIKNFMVASSVAGNSRIAFWSGSGGSFPYFCASGQSSVANNSPKLSTGLMSSAFSSSYPDFPTACFAGVCMINFQGINILASNYATNNNLNFLGITFVDFPGNDLISFMISNNGNLFGKCTLAQLSTGCTLCSLAGLCMACNNLLHYVHDSSTSSCLAESGYYLDPPSIPILCSTSMSGCLTCSSATVCISCSATNNFVMSTSGDCVCDPTKFLQLLGGACVCAPGMSLNPNGICQSGSYSEKFVMSLISFNKIQNQNKFQIKIKIDSNSPTFANIDYQTCIIPNFPYKQKIVTYNQTSGQISLVFVYNNSLNTNSQMQVTFFPPSQNSQLSGSPTTIKLPETTDNNLSLKVYTSQTYQLMPVLKIMSYILLGLAIGGFLFGLIFSSKLMGVEMILVVQLAYVGLISMEKLEPLLYSLIVIWPVNGFNKFLPDKQLNQKPPRINVVGYSSWFLSNFNINILILLLLFTIGTYVHIYSIVKGSKQIRQKAYNIYKEWGFSVLLFFQMHLVVSTGISILYGMDQLYGLLIGIFFTLLIIAETALLVIQPKNFGDYKNFFASQKFNSNFYVIMVFIRYLLALSIVFLSQKVTGLCISLSVLIILLVYLFIFKPYKQKIRPIFNLVVMIINLSIYLGYKSKIIDEANWLTTYAPVFLLLLLIICVIVNILFMIKHRFQIISKKIDPLDKEIKNTNQSQIQIQKQNWKQNIEIFSKNENIKDTFVPSEPEELIKTTDQQKYDPNMIKVKMKKKSRKKKRNTILINIFDQIQDVQIDQNY